MPLNIQTLIKNPTFPNLGNPQFSPNTQIAKADPWQASSLLHKAIRRSDNEVAFAAAVRFFQLRGASIWRRLLLIAIEDIGIASIEAVALAARACDANWRGGTDNDLAIIASVVSHLVDAAKDRSTDYLICAARRHPALEQQRCHVGSSSLDDRISMAVDIQLPLTTRAIAAWFASGIEFRDEPRVGRGNLVGLLDRFAASGVSDDLLSATLTACRKTREPICIMAPVLWMEAFCNNNPSGHFICERPVPVPQVIAGMPLYCFDKHTRIGKAAITRLSVENRDIAELFSQHVADFKARDAVAMAAYYSDATPISQQFMWSGSDQLEQLGAESDFWKVGVPLHAVNELIGVVHKNLPHLNELRRELYVRQISRKE